MDEPEKGEHKYTGYDVLHKVVKKQGEKSSSCNIYLPLDWEGKKVVVIRLDK